MQTRCTKPTSITVDKRPGYVASAVTLETNCGLTETPWILEAKRGQKINLTLTYFNWKSDDQDNTLCAVKMGYLFDLDTEDIVNICGSTSRVSHLYTTQGHQLQLLLDRKVLADKQFIIKYEGNIRLLLVYSATNMLNSWH